MPCGIQWVFPHSGRFGNVRSGSQDDVNDGRGRRDNNDEQWQDVQYHNTVESKSQKTLEGSEFQLQ